jgi:nucleotide-binding universal stress UspA family protein
MILIGYDGSDDAKSAIEQAGSLFGGQPAVVVTVWEPYTALLARTPIAMSMAYDDMADVDAAAQRTAEQTAEEGAGLARAAGLQATARVRAREGNVAQAVLAEADQADASAVVLGSRGLGGIGSLLLGSVSHAVLQHADRAVVVVPSAKVARGRGERLRRDPAA